MDLKTIRNVLLEILVIYAMCFVYISGLVLSGYIDPKLAYLFGGVIVWIFWVAFS